VPYYSEAESRELRERFEAIVLRWPGVAARRLFGSPSYTANGTTFAMLVDGGIVLTRLDDERRAALLSEPGADYFVGHGRVMKRWVLVRVGDPGEVERFVPFIEASYAAASGAG
jgi:TfoX/Sxy family transcriptional regulator of competence genes